MGRKPAVQFGPLRAGHGERVRVFHDAVPDGFDESRAIHWPPFFSSSIVPPTQEASQMM
jgi:hypothetical protein